MKMIYGQITRLPPGYWDTPDYYTVLSEDGTRSHAVLIRSDTRDWYWIQPILGDVPTEAQKEIDEIPLADLKATSRLKVAPCGVAIDPKFIQAEADRTQGDAEPVADAPK